jgi:hypothetical protein
VLAVAAVELMLVAQEDQEEQEGEAKAGWVEQERHQQQPKEVSIPEEVVVVAVIASVQQSKAMEQMAALA